MAFKKEKLVFVLKRSNFTALTSKEALRIINTPNNSISSLKNVRSTTIKTSYHSNGPKQIKCGKIQKKSGSYHSNLNKEKMKSCDNEIELVLNESNAGAMLQEGTYYLNQSEKLSKYIKKYFEKYKDYPKSKISFYKFGRLIGRGAFGKVSIGLHIWTGRIVAIKSFNKKKKEFNSQLEKEKIYHETNLMKLLRHNSIVRILETIETDNYFLIVMEYVTGGDWLNFVKKRAKLNENVAKIIFKQLITSIKYIHSRNIVHRDIKLDNILIDLNNNIKICDFGVSKEVRKGELLTDRCGTPAYIAPEIIKNNGYDGFPVDIWSSGVVWYAMLSGTVPFKASKLEELHTLIEKGNYAPIADVSQDAIDLISSLLEIDPKKRITIDKVLSHPWLMNINAIYSNESLFTKAEFVLWSKTNVDYRNCTKQEMIEDFTIKNWETLNDGDNKNAETKSTILAPFNTSWMNKSEYVFDDLLWESKVIEFEDTTKKANRIYELNNNAEIDHGLLIKHAVSKNSGENKTKEWKEEVKEVNNKIENKKNNNDESEKRSPSLSHPKENEFITKKDSQRNNSTMTNSSTMVIDESIWKIIENWGYNKEFIQKCWNMNELNYGTATYFLVNNYNDISI